jgi:hypothetical protein
MSNKRRLMEHKSQGLLLPLASEIERITDDNRRAIDDYLFVATDFFDVLAALRGCIKGAFYLANANGGGYTANALAQCADDLAAGISSFHRAVTELGKAELMLVDREAIAETVQLCGALIMCINAVVTADKHTRPTRLDLLKDAVSKADDKLAHLFTDPAAKDRIKLILMLHGRLKRGMHIRPALVNILRTNPDLFGRVMGGDKVTDTHVTSARKLMERSGLA